MDTGEAHARHPPLEVDEKLSLKPVSAPLPLQRLKPLQCNRRQLHIGEKPTQVVSYAAICKGINVSSPSHTYTASKVSPFKPFSVDFTNPFKGYYQHQSNIVFGDLTCKKSCTLKPSMDYCGKKAVLFKKSDKARLINKINHVLIGKFSHGRPRLSDITDFFCYLKLRGSIKVRIFDSKHIYILCELFEDFIKIWLEKFWFVKGFQMRVFKWNADFNPKLESPVAPVWVQLYGLPLFLFEKEALMSIANAIGNPICISNYNLNSSNLSYASFCVELDVTRPLMDEIWIDFGNELEDSKDHPGEKRDGFWQKLSYGSIPSYCEFCAHLDHSMMSCKQRKDKGIGEYEADGISAAGESVAADYGKTAAGELTSGLVVTGVPGGSQEHVGDNATEEVPGSGKHTGTSGVPLLPGVHVENAAGYQIAATLEFQEELADRSHETAGEETAEKPLDAGYQGTAGEEQLKTAAELRPNFFAAEVDSAAEGTAAAITGTFTGKPLGLGAARAADIPQIAEPTDPGEHKTAAGTVLPDGAAGAVAKSSTSAATKAQVRDATLAGLVEEDDFAGGEGAVAAAAETEGEQAEYAAGDGYAIEVAEHQGCWADLVEAEHEQQLAMKQNAILEWDATQVKAFVHKQIEDIKQEIGQTELIIRDAATKEPKIKDTAKEEKQLARELKFVRARKNLKEYFMASAKKINSDLERKRSEKKEKTLGNSFKYGEG